MGACLSSPKTAEQLEEERRLRLQAIENRQQVFLLGVPAGK